jgi:glutathione S-transferase
LWHFPVSHFNEKVRWALDYKQVPHVRETLTIDYLPRALWATGQGSLPILHLDGRAIADSTRIIAAIEERWREPALYPADARQRAQALALEDYFDEGLGPAVRAAVVGALVRADPALAIDTLATGWPETPRRLLRRALPVFKPFYLWRHKIDLGRLEQERQTVRAAMDRIVAERQPSGYLVGDSFSVADLTAAALLSVAVLPPEMQYRASDTVPEAILELQRGLHGHEALAYVQEMYRRHRGVSAEIAA